MAEQRCPRVDTRRTAKDLEQQIRNMELRIQQGSSSSVNVDDITRRWDTTAILNFYLAYACKRERIGGFTTSLNDFKSMASISCTKLKIMNFYLLIMLVK